MRHLVDANGGEMRNSLVEIPLQVAKTAADIDQGTAMQITDGGEHLEALALTLHSPPP
jgi:hypothetical protein